MQESGNLNIRKSRIKWISIGVILLIAIAVTAWVLFFRDNSPASVNSQTAEKARQEALSEVEPVTVDSLDGIWTIDTEIGVFDQKCLTEVCNSSFAGFRIDEELVGIGGKTVVGRTPGIQSQFAIEGSTIFLAGQEGNTTIVVDMVGLTTDDAGRNNAIKRQAIETEKYPEAYFDIKQPIDFNTESDLQAGFEIEVRGDLTIHGVTREERIVLNVSFDGSRILVYGELSPIILADYEIDKPRSAVVLSVEGEAVMEFQLYFKKLG